MAGTPNATADDRMRGEMLDRAEWLVRVIRLIATKRAEAASSVWNGVNARRQHCRRVSMVHAKSVEQTPTAQQLRHHDAKQIAVSHVQEMGIVRTWQD